MDGEVSRRAGNQTASVARCCDLARRFNYFIKQHDKRMGELSHYRARCYELEEPHANRLAARLRKHEKELTVLLWVGAVDGTNPGAPGRRNGRYGRRR